MPLDPPCSCPALQRLCLNGLCGASGWSWNASPGSLPQGQPPPAFPALTHCQASNQLGCALGLSLPAWLSPCGGPQVEAAGLF